MMTKKYVRLTFNERIEIEKLLSHNKSYADIATVLNRSKSTIQRDVIKQGCDSYKAMTAKFTAVGNSSNRKDGKTRCNGHLWWCLFFAIYSFIKYSFHLYFCQAKRK